MKRSIRPPQEVLNGPPVDPLTSTFRFVKGIGETAERRLWSNGIVDWKDLDSPGALLGVSPTRESDLRRSVDRARQDLSSGKAHFVREGLDNSEHWRAYRRFTKKCVFLDIETTGLNASDQVTLIGMYDGEGVRILERGKDLHEFPRILEQFSFIVTFNGRSFDVPFLKREFPGLKVDQAHWDLRWALQRIGYRGGLKTIEEDLHFARPGPLSKIGGFDAVILWDLHQKGHREALPILRRYLAEDVLGLRPLADFAYNAFAEKHPLPIEPLPPGARPECDLPYDPKAIPRLLG